MKPIILRYGEKRIPIYYECYNSVHTAKSKGSRGIQVLGSSSGDEKDFKKIEESAQTFLIHNATKKESRTFHLTGIDKVRQTIIGYHNNNHLEIELILEGIAVLEKS